jgi:hypothetical protein
MVLFAIGLNVSLALLCLVVAWRLWQLKRLWGQLADRLIVVEARMQLMLEEAPRAIAHRQQSLQQVYAYLSHLDAQLHRTRQALRLLGLGQRAWRQRHQWRTRFNLFR